MEDYSMYNRAKTSGFVLGLIGGILNAIIALLAFIDLAPILGYISDIMPGLALIMFALILVCVLNFIGACICRNRRTAGGILMLVSALILLLLIIISAAGGGFDAIGSSFMLIVWIISQLLSIAGAIICLSGPDNYYASPYGQPYGQPYAGQPQQPYGQPYGQQPQQPQYQPPQQQPQQPEDK